MFSVFGLAVFLGVLIIVILATGFVPSDLYDPDLHDADLGDFGFDAGELDDVEPEAEANQVYQPLTLKLIKPVELDRIDTLSQFSRRSDGAFQKGKAVEGTICYVTGRQRYECKCSACCRKRDAN